MYFGNVNQRLDNNYVQPSVSGVEPDIDDENLYIEFNDQNGIVEKTDFNFSSAKAKQAAQSYLKGLNPYCDGKHTWTQALLDLANNLIGIFNRTNSYAYDTTTDEFVKDTKSSIIYGKDGRIQSTTVTTPYSQEVTTYKYYRNGEIDSITSKDNYKHEYRKDGTRFSSVTNAPDFPTETIYYNQDGKMTSKTVEGSQNRDEYTYDENEKVIRHFHKDSRSGYQDIYLNGKPVLTTLYDGKGRVTNYTDRYFEKKGEDIVVQGYLSTTRIRNNEEYNTLYRESPIDGKITRPVRQGTSGTCYAAGIINSLVLTSAGRQLLDDALPNDYDTSKCVVKFDGLGKVYNLPASEISHNMSRLGRKDGDYAGMILAFEKFREADKTEAELARLPKSFFVDHRGDDDRRVDSGNAAEFFYALTGKVMNQSGKKITDADLEKARQCLATGRGVVNAGTVQIDNKIDEIPQADRAMGITPRHNLSVRNIGSSYVTLYDSVTEREINYPIDKFKRYFTNLYWATVD